MPNPFFQITINPTFREVAKRFRDIDIKKASQQGLEEMAFKTEAEAKRVTPIDTGRLRASVQTDIGNLRARVAPHTNYAIFVHEGTKFVKGRPFLTWGFEKASAVLFGGHSPFVAYLQKEIDSKLK